MLQPLKLAGKVGRRIGRAVEMTPGVINLLHPEQVLSKSPFLRKLYDFTVDEERKVNLLRRHFTSELDKIVKKYNINSEERANQFLTTLEFYNYNKRLPTPQEAAQMPKWTFKAAAEHLQKIEDPIWQEYSKLSNPETYKQMIQKLGIVVDPAELQAMTRPQIGYIAGHFTHFPVKSYTRFLGDEISRIEELLKTTPMESLEYFNYKSHLSELKKAVDKYSKVDASLNAVRYKQLPKGGFFGPLDEQRQTHKQWGYRRDYRDVMEEYIDGAVRKLFLDRYMPIANKLIQAEPNAALRQYAFDYVTAQRGALASRSKLFWNESLSQLFPDPATGYSNIAKAVDFATRFQYLAKIGLSWFRFPIVNSTQPLLTLYPVVGPKTFTKAYLDAMDPKIWKEAKDVGVIFEMQLRKGLAEALGRTPRISKVEKTLTAPATVSEELNRVVAYAAGKRQAQQLGLKGQDIIDHAIKLVNRTQFLYTKAGMPLIMSRSPIGRLLFQFRTFTSNYVNYLVQLWKSGDRKAFARALGSLGALSGTAAIPFNLWETAREALLRKAGIDIGEVNPVEFATERMGFSPPINLGQALEPFNIPSDVTQLFGPTIGPVLKVIEEWYRKPEETGEHIKRFAESFFGPPMVRVGRGILTPEVRLKPTTTYPMGRQIGERSIAETLFLRPPLEATRKKYLFLMANAFAGGRPDIALGFRNKLEQLGVWFGPEDMRMVNQMATKLRGVPQLSQ